MNHELELGADPGTLMWEADIPTGIVTSTLYLQLNGIEIALESNDTELLLGNMLVFMASLSY